MHIRGLTLSLPFFKSLQRKKISSFVRNDFKIYRLNIVLLALIVGFAALQAIFINHLNTVGYRLTDLTNEQARLEAEQVELQAVLSETQVLENIQSRADALGMVAVSEYTFISQDIPVFVQR